MSILSAVLIALVAAFLAVTPGMKYLVESMMILVEKLQSNPLLYDYTLFMISFLALYFSYRYVFRRRDYNWKIMLTLLALYSGEVLLLTPLLITTRTGTAAPLLVAFYNIFTIVVGFIILYVLRAV